ncbi:MAG: SCP2 sterol-binding domain-containing protein [Gammaproteobacteria bacterium]|nr:SCP2 sterol-binding domain-containing protein [Gammaproteobacteria bacterium]
MSTPIWFTAAVESACNGALALDPEIRARLGALADKVIAVELLGLNIRLYFLPHAQGVQVLSQYDGEPDTLLRGAPLSLLRLALSHAPSDELFAGGAELRGDTATGQAFQDILRALHLDWEELLARVAGDTVAHQAGRAARTVSAQAQHTARTLEEDVHEYLIEETGLLVNHHEVAAFLDAIDTLRSDTDRLEARMRRLETTLAGKD